MKKILFSFLVLGFAMVVKAQSCKDIQTGSFRIVADDVNPNESILTRTKTTQVEEVKSLGIKLQFSLRWTSDCSYVLFKPQLLAGEMPGLKDDQEVYVKITKVTSSYYTAEITSNFNDMKLVKDIQILK